MTVNELIAQLQVLSAQGHGDRAITLFDFEQELTSNLSIDASESFEEMRYWNGKEFVDKHSIVIAN